MTSCVRRFCLQTLLFWCAFSQPSTVTTTTSWSEVRSTLVDGTSRNVPETITTSVRPGRPCECVSKTHEENGRTIPDYCADHYGDSGCMPWCYVDAGCEPRTPSEAPMRAAAGPFPAQYFGNDTAWVMCEQADRCWDVEGWSDTLGRSCAARLAALGPQRGCSEHSSTACCACGGGRHCTTTVPAGFDEVAWSRYAMREAIATTTPSADTRAADVSRLYGASRRDAVLAQERSLLDAIINGNLSEASGDYGYASIIGSVVSANASESVSHTGGGGAIIPASTLVELGVEDAVVMVTRYSDIRDTFQSPGIVSGDVVGVTLFSIESRRPLVVEGLEQRIHVNIPVDRDLPEGDRRCAYWSEALDRWITSGVQTTFAPDGSLVCDTSHLSIFTAIWAEFEHVFACTNARVLTPEGVRAIGESAWIWRPPFVLLVCFTVSQIAVLVFALRTDARDKATRIWDDRNFLTENIEYKDDSTFLQTQVKAMFRFADLPEERRSSSSSLRGREESRRSAEEIARSSSRRNISTLPKRLNASEDLDVVEPSSTGRDLKAEAWEAVASEVVCRCALATLARNQQVAVADLPSILKDKKLNASIMGTINTLQKTPFIQQVIALFFVMQPWLKLDNFSIRMTAFIRAVLLVAKLLGALLISALFFENFDSATARDCPPPSDLKEIIVNCVIVGVFSALLSSIPLMALYQTQWREFYYQEEWADGERESHVRFWSRCDSICSVFALLYCSFCIFYLTAFLANLNPQGENQWLTSIVTVLLREFIFTPVSMALMTAFLCEVVAVRYPQVAQNMYKRLGLTMAKPTKETRPNTQSSVSDDTGGGLADDAEAPPDDGARVQHLDEGRVQIVPIDFLGEPVWASDSVLAGFALKSLPVSHSQVPGATPMSNMLPANGVPLASSGGVADCLPEPNGPHPVCNPTLWNNSSLTSGFGFDWMSSRTRISSWPPPVPDVPAQPDVECMSLQNGIVSRPPLFPDMAPQPDAELAMRRLPSAPMHVS